MLANMNDEKIKQFNVYWPALQMLLTDPDGRELGVKALLPSKDKL